MEPIPPDLFTVDELAHRAGTTTRSVRAYQTKGLLPAPRKIGRIAYYGPEHLARLHLIERLLSRGFLLSAIGDLLRASEQGSGLDGVLGHPALQGRSAGVPAPPGHRHQPSSRRRPSAASSPPSRTGSSTCSGGRRGEQRSTRSAPPIARSPISARRG